MNLQANRPLYLALSVSLTVHAALLTVRFAAPETFNRLFEDTSLEVILVNTRTNDIPIKAQALAQANMAGGGELEQGRATSPLPPAVASVRADSSEQNNERALREMQAQQNIMLASIKNKLATMPPGDPQKSQLTPEQVQREEKRRQLIKLLAEIERRIQTENARPRKRYISPSTRETVYAVYYDRLRRSIEEKGTGNFPQQDGKKLYGELVMIVLINNDGRLLSTEIVESSGFQALDRQAQIIVRSAGPFGQFNSEMRLRSDQISVISRFKFTRDDTLEARLSAN